MRIILFLLVLGIGSAQAGQCGCKANMLDNSAPGTFSQQVCPGIPGGYITHQEGCFCHAADKNKPGDCNDQSKIPWLPQGACDIGCTPNPGPGGPQAGTADGKWECHCVN